MDRVAEFLKVAEVFTNYKSINLLGIDGKTFSWKTKNQKNIVA